MNNIDYLVNKFKETLTRKNIEYIADDNNIYLFSYVRIDNSIYVYNKSKGTEVKYNYSDNKEILSMLRDLVGVDKNDIEILLLQILWNPIDGKGENYFKVGYIKNKDSLHKLFKYMKCKYLGVICKDCDGEEIGIYLHEYEFEDGDSILLEDCLGELRLYATDDKKVFNEYASIFNKVDKYFYEFDSYPTYCDWVKFPITDIKIFPMDEDKQTNMVAQYCISKGMYRIIHPNKEDGLNIFVVHPHTGSVHEEFSDIKRCQWLKEAGCLVYETFKDYDGNIIYLREV